MVKALVLLALPVLILAGPALVLRDEMPVVTAEMVDEINASGSWKASLDWVNGMTIGQAKRKLGGAHRPVNKFPAYKPGVLDQYLQIPDAFSWQGNQCLGAIRNQGDCGSCWAFGASETFSDRVCLGTNAAQNVVLSPQWLVSCDNSNYGCGGGYLDLVWDYINTNGIPLETCDPYNSGDNDESGSCSANCSTFYQSTTPVPYNGPAAIQTGLLTGPLETCFQVYQDFMSYSSGIYVHTTGDFVGGHCTKMVGWGNDNGVNYWIVANSWGTGWGQEGFFWIEFGQCGIDTEAMAGDFQGTTTL